VKLGFFVDVKAGAGFGACAYLEAPLTQKVDFNNCCFLYG
jgi:hypothetical protein